MSEIWMTRKKVAEFLGMTDARNIAKLHNRNREAFEGKFIEKPVFQYNKEGLVLICKLSSKSKNRAYKLLISIGFSDSEAADILEVKNDYLEKQSEIASIESKKFFLSDDTIVLVDPEHEWVMLKYRWYCNGRYVESRDVYEDGRSIFLHRYLMNAKAGEIVDHKNRNPFDNRKSVNLRISTEEENRWNSIPHKRNKLGYKGVKELPSGNFFVVATTNGEFKRIGTYSNLQAAANAYNHWVKKVRDEFAYLNEVDFMSEEECQKFKVERD